MGSSISTPYFFNLSNSKDFTFAKNLLENDLIFHSEYREAFRNSNQNWLCFNRKNSDTSSHIFANLNGKFNDDTNFDLKLQNVNNDNYLKIHDIKSYTPIESDSVLSSFEVVKLLMKIQSVTKVRLYEDLSKNNSDKYQYVFLILISKRNKVRWKL